MARSDRVAQTLKKEIGNIIHDELKDPRLGFVTVTAVEITPDLKYAKVFFSVLGKEEEIKNTKEALNSAIGFIRRLIAQRIDLRFTPEIIFREDRSSEYSVKIEEVLNEIKALEKISAPKKPEPENKPRKVRKSEPKKSRRVHKKK